jgi:hypothetical protein
MATDKQPYPFSGTTIIDGTKSVTSSATALATSTAVSGVEIVADSGNTQNILIGNSTSQNRILAAGAGIYIGVNNLSLIYVKSASGTQSCTYLAVV